MNDCSARDIQKWECEAALLRDTGLLLFAAPAGGWAGITNFTHAGTYHLDRSMARTSCVPSVTKYMCKECTPILHTRACAKSLADIQGTVMSPWIVQHEAVEPFLCDAPEQIPAPLPYLCEDDGCRRTFDLRLGVKIQPGGSPHAYTVSEANLRDLYWTFSQVCAAILLFTNAPGDAGKPEPDIRCHKDFMCRC